MKNANRGGKAAATYHNRLGAIMLHCTGYSFRGTSRLARDAQVSKSTISHLVRGRTSPLYLTSERIARCLEVQLGLSIDLRDIFSVNGTYPTRFVCDLVGCPGCLPDQLFAQTGEPKDSPIPIAPGQWTGDACEFLDLPSGGDRG